LISDRERSDAELNLWWRGQHSPEEINQRFKDERERREEYAPGRREFLEAMAHQPSLFVQGTSRSQIITSSRAI